MACVNGSSFRPTKLEESWHHVSNQGRNVGFACGKVINWAALLMTHDPQFDSTFCGEEEFSDNFTDTDTF